VPVSDIDEARAALRAGKPGELLGVAECGWLDAKGGVYHLDDPAGAEELVKDVAGFANARAGGLLVVGFSTRKEHDGETLDAVRPVPRAQVDLDRHRKLIRERVIPPPRGVSVEWIDCGSGNGILVIDVPAQPAARLPHVVPGPTRTPNVSRMSVAVPVREGDATPWLPQAEIQRLLAAGWTATGGPSEQVLSSLIERAITAARRDRPPEPGFELGVGEPGWKGHFHQAWNDLMNQRIWIGHPATEVFAEGPGVVQHFESELSLFGWVICALPHQRPVAVAGEVWQALQAAGAGALGGDPLAAIGFPVPSPQATQVIDAQAQSVDLTGGRWGKGRLVRLAGGTGWRWEPVVRFSMDMTRAAGYWTADPAVRQLRLRVIASLPRADASELAITGQRHRALQQALPESDLAHAIIALSRHRGADLEAAEWKRGPNRNALDAFSYSSLIAAPDGQTALSAEVMMALPNTMNSDLVTCAEIRIEDLTAWAVALAAAGAPPRQDLRLSMQEVADFFGVAWQTATEQLATVVTADSTTAVWTDPPTVELRLTAERRYDGTPAPPPMLDDYIDLHALGRSDRGQLREMAVTIIAPQHLEQPDRQNQTRKALVFMAHQFGFLEADEYHL
jgi:hypothetical protein